MDKTTIQEAAQALRIAVEQKRRTQLAVEHARVNRRNVEESILFGFKDKDEEKAYGSSEAARKTRVRLEHPAEYQAHKDAQTADLVAAADLELARTNFYEAFALALVAAPALEAVLA